MWITHFRILNYKGFQDSGIIELAPTFNVIVGRNNAGKTALIEALGTRIAPLPHRSIIAQPARTSPINSISSTTITGRFDRQEIVEILETMGGEVFVAPRERETDESVILRYDRAIADGFEVEATWSSNGWQRLRTVDDEISMGGTAHALALRLSKDGHLESIGQQRQVVGTPALAAARIAQAMQSRIYQFRAERLNVGEFQVGQDRNLAPNSANLALVLHNLQSENPSRWQRYTGYVRRVFSEITEITVPVVNGPAVRIHLWNVDRSTEREDLALSLSDSGTGVGQVLAMLYVVVVSEEPRTILIDEPQSFLHPGAIRKLFEILRAHRQHQYVVATHSPVVLAAAQGALILQVRRQGYQSAVGRLPPDAATSLRALLADVGARLSDVFGADQVLWVEGRTEELCFPELMAATQDLPITATAVLGLRSTGELESRHAAAMIDIYRRLTRAGALLPPAIAFILDREGRSENERADLVRQSRGLIHFTPRRMYENYLINAGAIAHVLGALDEKLDGKIGRKVVVGWLDKVRWDRDLFGHDVQESLKSDVYWHENVDAAKVLIRAFAELSENRVPYEKVKHGLALTKWILKNSPDELTDIQQLIREVLISADSAAHTIDAPAE